MLSEEHKRLHQLVGTWSGDEIVHRSPFAKRDRAVGAWTCRAILNGMFVVMEYLQQNEDGVVMRGHGVIGYDAKRARYTLHWFDTLGAPPSGPGVGVWNDGALAFTHVEDGHAWRTVFSLVDGWLQFRAEANDEVLLEGQYRRSAIADPIHASM